MANRIHIQNTRVHPATASARVRRLSHHSCARPHESQRRRAWTIDERITSVIHTTIRSPSRILPSAVIRTNSHSRTETKKSASTQSSNDRSKSTTNSFRVTKIHRVHRSPSYSRQNTQTNTDSSSNFEQEETDGSIRTNEKVNNDPKHPYRIISAIERQQSTTTKEAPHEKSSLENISTGGSIPIHDRSDIKALSARMDLLNTINDFHRLPEKKKKNYYCCRCTPLCVVVSIISILLLAITIAVILIVLLTKNKTTTTITPIAILRWNSTGITVAGITSSPGNATNQFRNPFGLAIDFSNTLYIGDRGNNRIQRWKMGASNGETVAGRSNGARGNTSTDFYGPTYILLDSNSNLYISDSLNYRVQFWSSGATSGSTIAGVTGVPGTIINRFNYPYGVTRDSQSGTVYIADFNNHRVVSYSSNVPSGTVIAGGQGGGINNTQLKSPAGLYLDSSTNSLVIANFGAHNIIRWSFDTKSWTRLAGSINGSSGNTSTLLNSPTDVTFDPMGNMYVVDMLNNRVQFFLNGQSNGVTIAGVTSQIGNTSTMLNYPATAVLDTQLNLYVADMLNQRIQKFVRY